VLAWESTEFEVHVNKSKNQNTRQHRKLTLHQETVVSLTDDLLKNVAGGNVDATNSNPFSKCNTQCV
jgi:hypothetical protein